MIQSAKALNRSYLARQLLLERSAVDVVDAVKYLVALQAQNTGSPYVALFSRLQNFKASNLSEGIVARNLVRTVLMRGTLHLVEAQDALHFWRALSDMLLRVSAGPLVAKMDTATLLKLKAFVHRNLSKRAKTLNELEGEVHERFALRHAKLSQLLRAIVPIVQVPPRGILGAGGIATWTSLEPWVGGSLPKTAGPDELILRYLASYGPATVADIQRFSGLTRLTATLTRMQSQLCIFEWNGRKMYDVTTSYHPDPETPAPVRFLGEYDSALLAHVDRSRILSQEFSVRTWSENGYLATFLVDGYVCGTWSVSRTKGAKRIVVTPFKKLQKADKAEVAREASALLEMLTGQSGDAEFIS